MAGPELKLADFDLQIGRKAGIRMAKREPWKGLDASHGAAKPLSSLLVDLAFGHGSEFLIHLLLLIQHLLQDAGAIVAAEPLRPDDWGSYRVTS